MRQYRVSFWLRIVAIAAAVNCAAQAATSAAQQPEPDAIGESTPHWFFGKTPANTRLNTIRGALAIAQSLEEAPDDAQAALKAYRKLLEAADNKKFRGGDVQILSSFKQNTESMGNNIWFSIKLHSTGPPSGLAKGTRYNVSMYYVLRNESSGNICASYSSMDRGVVEDYPVGHGMAVGFAPGDVRLHTDIRNSPQQVHSPCRFDVGDYTLTCYSFGCIEKEQPTLLDVELKSFRIVENPRREDVLKQLAELAQSDSTNHATGLEDLLFQVSANDEFIKQVADVGLRPRYLDLSNAPLTAKGIEQLSRLHDLETLRLTGSSVDDRCVPALLRLGWLEALDVDGTSLSQSAIEELREALPNTRILANDK